MLEKVDLPGIVRGLKEWSEGYEALEAIPFSFVIEFKDGGVWSLYSDSEEEKVILIVLNFVETDAGCFSSSRCWGCYTMQLGCDIYVSNMYHLYTHFKLAAQQ